MAEEKEVPKYNINDLATALGIAPASARVWLRSEGIEKPGRGYGWNTKTELYALVKKHATSKKSAESAPKAEKKAAKKAA